MNTIEQLQEELDREATRSRRTLENMPEGKHDWKPHEKSMPFGSLAELVAIMPSWVTMVIGRDELDLNPPGGSQIPRVPHLLHHFRTKRLAAKTGMHRHDEEKIDFRQMRFHAGVGAVM